MARTICTTVDFPAHGYEVEATATAYNHKTVEEVCVTVLHNDAPDSFPELEEMPADVQGSIMAALYEAASESDD